MCLIDGGKQKHQQNSCRKSGGGGGDRDQTIGIYGEGGGGLEISVADPD